MAECYGLEWGKHVVSVDPYFYRVGLSGEAMAQIYSAFDVYFAPSAGEGFNIPLIEAASCGIPVVANACTSQTENVCPDASWLVEPAAAVTNTLSSQWFVADALGRDCSNCGHHKPGLVDALEEAYQALQDKEKAKELSHKARKFATKYDTDRVVHQFWQPFLQEVIRDLGSADGQPGKLWTPPQNTARGGQ